MKKKAISLVFGGLLLVLLASCGCKHEWQDATCTTPATCVKCGESAGSPLGHNWKDATCTEPETCSVCGATNGQPHGHQWQTATCTTSETCSVCGETQGDAPLGHTLDENGICTVCGEAAGIPLTLLNYEQYLAFSITSETLKALEDRGSYVARCEVGLSVSTDPRYTYHGVTVKLSLTPTSKNWVLTESCTYPLDESGYFNGIASKGKNVVVSLARRTGYGAYDGTLYGSADSALRVGKPGYLLEVVSITGYVLPE